MSYFSKMYNKLREKKFMDHINGLRQKNRKAFAISIITIIILVPIISILFYKMISGPYYVKKNVSETMTEDILVQPEVKVNTLANELSDKERNESENENQSVTYDLEALKSELLFLKDQMAQVPNEQITNANFEEILEKVQAGTATKQEIEALLAIIEYLKSSILTKAEQEELENLKQLLEKMQNSAVTGTDLTAVKDSLGALKEEIDKIKEEMGKNLEQSNSDLEDKINKITICIAELEKAILDNHYTKEEVDVLIGNINKAIDDINHNSLVEINTKIDEINNKTLAEINTSINNIKNEMLTTIHTKLQEITNNITNSNAGMQDEIGKVIDKIDDLEAAIANNHYTKAEIDALVADINAAIEKITNEELTKINKNIGILNSLKTTSKISLVDAMNEVFQSASDGKKLLAAAITGKGINTAADDTYEKMAKNIEGLVTMSSDPAVLFNVTSWTAPEDCIAVMSFSVSMECNSDYDKVALVRLNGVKDWTFGWGGNSSSDAGWHTRGTSGNVTWKAKKGVTYSLSFDPHYSGSGKGNVLTWGWGNTTWIVPKTKGIKSKAVPDQYFFQNVKTVEIEENVKNKEEIAAEKNTEVNNTEPNITGENNTEESNTEESNTEESNTEESNTEEGNTEESNTEKSNTEESNTEESNTKERYTEENNTEESNTKERNIEESNTQESNTE